MATVRRLLAQGSVVLLCQCAEVAMCHRRVVAALVQAVTEAEVVHLGPTR